MTGGKTYTQRRIEIRSPDGKLLSTTLQKTISYGSKAVLPDSPENPNDLLVNTTILTPLPRRRESIAEQSERTEFVDLGCGDSTIYGDKWSQFDQNTLVRRARVVEPQIRFAIPAVDSLSAFVYEINAQRRSHGVQELHIEDRLMHMAKREATQMSLDKQIRISENTNVWIGTSLNVPRVVDEWAKEMENWNRNYFAAHELRRIGIGKAIIDSKEPLSIVVVVYD